MTAYKSVSRPDQSPAKARSLVGNGQAGREKDNLIDAKATTPNIEAESAGNDASLGVWVVPFLHSVGIIMLNAAASV
jgi:hypothetical protein